MIELLEQVEILFLELGDQHGVSPIIVGGIYIGVAWLIRNYRMEKINYLAGFLPRVVLFQHIFTLWLWQKCALLGVRGCSDHDCLWCLACLQQYSRENESDR